MGLLYFLIKEHLSRKIKRNKMKTKMVLRNENLWQRIESFSLDAENATFPFSKKLAKEENWSMEFTQKAIEEYKKFVYLCCVSPNGASPSETVDKVWHMHLIYTQSYWEDFCPNVLKRNLHHHPSTGGSSENAKHQNWFSETLENYREVFSQEAPEEIWKHQNQKTFVRKNWFKKFKFLSAASVFLLLISCSERSGGVLFKIFGWIIGIFVVMNILGMIIGSSQSGNRNKNNGGSSDGGRSGTSCSNSSSCSSGSSCGSSCGGGGCGGCGS